MEHPGNALAEIRKAKGFTQERLANEANVSVKTIQLLERFGTKSANVSTLCKLAEPLEVDISALVC